MGKKLDTGDTFPALSLKLVGGGALDLPGDLGGAYSMVLFYRGHW